MEEKVYHEYAKRYAVHSEAKELSKTAPAIMNLLAVGFILSEAYYMWNHTRVMAFNSGISDWLVISENYTPLLSFILPSVLLLIAFASLFDTRMYILAICTYSIDTIFCLFYRGDLLSWYLHLIFLSLMILSLKNIPLSKYFSGRLLSDGVYLKTIYEIDLRLERQEKREDAESSNNH